MIAAASFRARSTALHERTAERAGEVVAGLGLEAPDIAADCTRRRTRSDGRAVMSLWAALDDLLIDLGVVVVVVGVFDPDD